MTQRNVSYILWDFYFSMLLFTRGKILIPSSSESQIRDHNVIGKSLSADLTSGCKPSLRLKALYVSSNLPQSMTARVSVSILRIAQAFHDGNIDCPF